MKISIINGSPKIGKSTSQLMIEYLLPEIEEHEIELYNINKTALTETQITKITNSDVLIFAFPLYIDSIPAHLLKELITLEKHGFGEKEIMVYCIINNGFFEGIQNHIATKQMKLWCESARLTWGQALGIGAGEMYPMITNIPLGHGPNKNLGRALKNLAHNMITRSSGPDSFICVNWPRFIWRIQASSYWYPRAKANGLKKCDLLHRIDH